MTDCCDDVLIIGIGITFPRNYHSSNNLLGDQKSNKDFEMCDILNTFYTNQRQSCQMNKWKYTNNHSRHVICELIEYRRTIFSDAHIVN